MAYVTCTYHNFGNTNKCTIPQYMYFPITWLLHVLHGVTHHTG